MIISRTVISVAGVCASAVLLTTLGACGKKGDPLAPLRLVPLPVGELSARKTAQEVELRFVLPTANAGGGGPIDLDRIEIYAITIGPGAVTPPNRDLLIKERVVGTIAVKPPPVEGEEKKPAEADKRPAPGDRVTFVEKLTEDTLKPAPTAAAPAPTPPAPTPPAQTPTPPAPDAAAAAAAQPAAAPYPVRIYAARGISRSGRPGPPSTRLSIPLVAPVAPPSSVVARMVSEKAVAIDWTPPVAEPGAAPLTFNVLRPNAATAINPAPVTDVKLEVPPEYGKEQCFVVRTIQTIENVTIESDASAPACVTPLDRFPPAAPKGVRAVAEDGAVNLVWDQNTEADLAGYVILRGETPGETLQPLMNQPIKDATYRDTTVKPGVRYTYAVVAVDTATPPNTSAQSGPESVTAR